MYDPAAPRTGPAPRRRAMACAVLCRPLFARRVLVACWALVGCWALCGCRGAPPPPPDPGPTPPAPTWWMSDAPRTDPLADPRETRLVVRLGLPAVARAEQLYGPPTGGRLRGWWLRPRAPRPTGAWLLLSVSGGLYAVIAPPALVHDPGLTALARAGHAWRGILRGP